MWHIFPSQVGNPTHYAMSKKRWFAAILAIQLAVSITVALVSADPAAGSTWWYGSIATWLTIFIGWVAWKERMHITLMCWYGTLCLVDGFVVLATKARNNELASDLSALQAATFCPGAFLAWILLLDFEQGHNSSDLLGWALKSSGLVTYRPGLTRPSLSGRLMHSVSSASLMDGSLQSFADDFRDKVDQGGLDVYTCISLNILAEGHWGPNTRFLLMEHLVLLLILQVGVPIALLTHEMHVFKQPVKEKDLQFRIVGTAGYVYSTWNMYKNAADECRISFLALARAYVLPLHAVWPVILGEIINSGCGTILVFALFSAFLRTPDPFNLLANTVAINFIGNIDNEIVTENMKASAKENFESLADELDHTSRARPSTLWRLLYQTRIALLVALRTLGTAGMGCVFTILFALQHQDLLCKHLPWRMDFLADWPVCAKK